MIVNSCSFWSCEIVVSFDSTHSNVSVQMHRLLECLRTRHTSTKNIIIVLKALPYYGAHTLLK